MKSGLFFCFIVLIAACGDSNPHAADKTTPIFSYYLKEAFGDSIGQKKATYILVPKLGCKGCREDALQVLHQEAEQSRIENLTYIISPSITFPQTFTHPARILIDSSELINRINLPVSNIAILKTQSGKVMSLVSIRSETTDSIKYFLNR